MPAWLLFIFFLLFCSCDGYQFNVTRGAQGVSSDLFSNMGPSGTCPTRNDDRQAWCKAKNGDCSAQGCCICACTYSHSTFQMKASLNTATCVENRSFRSYAGCSQTFATMDQSHPLATLDLAVRGSKGMSDKLRPINCKIKSAHYLDQLNWNLLGSREKYTFSIRTIRTWPYKELTWTGSMPSSYFGYIMKINGDCGRRHKWNFCVVFKANGTRSWNFPDSSTKAPSVITTMSDTKTKIPTTITTTTGTMQVKSTTKVTSTTVTTIKTTSSTKAPSSKQVTTKAMTNKPSPETPKVSKSSTESSATTKSLQTEPKTGDVTAIKSSTDYNPGGREPNRGGNKLSGQDNEDDSTMIAIIAGVAAVICVAIVLLCVWLIISQRRKNRDAGTTVIANPRTGSQNHFPMPGLLKNPIFDDSVYAEPEERARRSAVGLIGNPSYDTTEDLLLKNPGAKDAWSMPLNNIRMKPLNTASRKIHRENTYDSTERCSRDKRQDEEKPMYHNPGYVIEGEKAVYQSLLKEDAHTQVNSDPNAETYQSLDTDGLMYQPLQKNTARKCQGDIPEYLVLLNPNEIPQNITPSPPEYQPPYSTGPPPADIEEPPEYADYADLDELEEIAAREGSKKCADQAPTYEAPVYNVLEGPNYDYACPGAVVYDVLEGPDPDSNGIINQGFGPPTYAVLEGPDTTS